MRHLINRQVIETTIQRKLDAFAVQQAISELYYDKMLGILERIFDKLAPGDAVIRVDKLEIDIGELPVSHLQSEIRLAEIGRRIEQQLTRLLDTQAPGRVVICIPQVHVADQWLFYKEHGYLPWNASIGDKDWEEEVLETFATEHAAVTGLRKLLASSQRACERICLQHDETFLTSLAAILTACNHQELRQLITELSWIITNNHPAPGRTSEQGALKKQYWQTCLQLAVDTQRGDSIALLAEAVRVNGHQPLLETAALKSGHAMTPGLTNLLSALSSKAFEPGTAAPEINITKTGEAIQPWNALQQTRPLHMGAQDAEAAKREEFAALEQGIFVCNAGLVLLHPFLSTFFLRLGMLKDGQFRDEAQQCKAVYLLHYLATGEPDAPEHQLALPKILCGFPLLQPVQPQAMHEDERAEAEDLLSAVIDQWSILGNTSAAGLREGFLQRNGKLSVKNDQPYLVVESNAIDVLIDRLPWNLSIISLPWLTELMKVDWR